MPTPIDILRETFGYPEFRPHQAEIVDAALSGRDVLAVMPTSAGKSICYQVPALLLDGLTIVVSPLISLMADQVGALRQMGVAASCLKQTIEHDFNLVSEAEVLALMHGNSSGRVQR